MNAYDWLCVAGVIVLTLAVGLSFGRRARRSVEVFFGAGHELPWWLAGTSLLATSFAPDTPLSVTRLVRESGVSGLWFYWGFVFAGLFGAFVCAPLWRRAGVITDAELIELRYSGRAAAALRFVTALYRALVLELITLGWVIAGMAKVLREMVDLPLRMELGPIGLDLDLLIVLGLMAVAVLYSLSSGLWGVVAADTLQFVIAWSGALLLAFFAVRELGGMSGLLAQLPRDRGTKDVLELLPAVSSSPLPPIVVGAYLAVQWWATMYIDGSGPAAQRFAACRDERHALHAGLWNLFVEHAIKPWPWILVALASLVVIPELPDHELAYPKMIAILMPVGLRGVMVASFFAAFLSTVDSLLNLSGAYLTTGLYRRFLAPDRPAEHYVAASRASVLLVAVLATMVALATPSVVDALRLKSELMAACGAAYLLRWLWWRVTATAELIALATGVLCTVGLHASGWTAHLSELEAFAWHLVIIASAGTVATVLAAYILPPEPLDRLRDFYRRVRPPLSWGPVRAHEPGEVASHPGMITGIIATAGLLLATIFGVGKLLFGKPVLGATLLALALACASVLLPNVRRRRSDGQGGAWE